MQYISIRRNVDFKRMYYQARYKVGFFIVVYLKKVKFNGVFLGITTSKKIGNAVKRNRVRRIIKAAFLEFLKNEQLDGFSVVIVAKKSCLNVKSYDILKELKNSIFLLRKNKIFYNN